jgi:hypothetical protein
LDDTALGAGDAAEPPLPVRVPKSRAQLEGLMAEMGFGPYPPRPPPYVDPEARANIVDAGAGGGGVRFSLVGMRRDSMRDRDFRTPPATKVYMRSSHLRADTLAGSIAVLRRGAEADAFAELSKTGGSRRGRGSATAKRARRAAAAVRAAASDRKEQGGMAPLEGFVKKFVANRVKRDPKFRFEDDAV